MFKVACVVNACRSELINSAWVVIVPGQECISGIPQGSVLGSLLFVIYINGLPEAITSDALLFADDTKLLRQITSREDAHILQCGIDSLRDWSERWLVKPCSHLR